MRIITVNVNGIRAACRHGFLTWLAEQDADVIMMLYREDYYDRDDTPEDKLEESAIFERVVSDDFNETAFTMPNAQVGSIVEWGYKTISPF